MNDRAVTPNYGERIMEESCVDDIRDLLTNSEIDLLVEILMEAPYVRSEASGSALYLLHRHIIERLNEESVEP